MQIFDLHCDTLYKANEGKGLVGNYEFSFEKAKKYKSYTQTMAIWIPDEYRNKSAWNLLENCCKLLKKIIEKDNDFIQIDNFNLLGNNPYEAILSVESGAVLCGKLENIEKLRKLGVRFLTLTWNGNNEIGDGILCENAKGLTGFGKLAIPELEKNSIIIDISHASEPLFWQVAELSQKPFVATHSNAREICTHKRNLTAEQFKYIVKTGGIVGLNFHKFFITDDGKANFSDLEKHLYYFLNLGGENAVALGSDFDGSEMPDCIKGTESMRDFYNYLLSKNYSEDLLNKIFYKNALEFCKKYDNI